MKKIILSLIFASLFLVSGCSYMPKWLTSPFDSSSEDDLQTQLVDNQSDEVIVYDTTEGQNLDEQVQEGIISNDLNALFYEQDSSAGSDPVNTADISSNKIPTQRSQINPSVNESLIPDNDIIYFSFDSSSMDEEVKSKINFHIKFLAENKNIRVVLEGHADERGSREYNLGLGELRALAVKDLMVLNSVSEDQIFVISYGEERPANPASNEEAWAQNRRVEIVYK